MPGLAIDPSSVAGTSWRGNQPNGSHCAYSSPVESNPYGAMQYGLCMYIGMLQHRCLMMILYADSGRSQGPGPRGHVLPGTGGRGRVGVAAQSLGLGLGCGVWLRR